MLISKLALRNILGAGLRTWLNVVVLSIAFVMIIWSQGLIDGMNNQMMTSLIDTEYGGGQFWHQTYDPYDPLTIEDAHAPLSSTLDELVSTAQATPILVTSSTIYPEGRIQTAQLRGIDPKQQIINIPAEFLKHDDPDVIPALIGARMAKQMRLKSGDDVTVRWRDVNGTFDATEVRIVQIMSTIVQSVDNGVIWIPLDRLREMLQAPNEATLLVVEKHSKTALSDEAPWVFHDLDYLLSDIKQLIRNKSVGSMIIYALLLGMGLLAIFDTQVLSIFRRRKEMGTLMALGMPRGQVIGLFTLEGSLHAIMALVVGAIWGIPVLMYSAAKGLGMPKEMMDNSGFALAERLYPSYGMGLVLGTTLLVLITVTVVSFLPTRRISKLKPTDALRGKFS